jgi:hypothetical protein
MKQLEKVRRGPELSRYLVTGAGTFFRQRYFLLRRKWCNFPSGFIFLIMEILLAIVNTLWQF